MCVPVGEFDSRSSQTEFSHSGMGTGIPTFHSTLQAISKTVDIIIINYHYNTSSSNLFSANNKKLVLGIQPTDIATTVEQIKKNSTLQ